MRRFTEISDDVKTRFIYASHIQVLLSEINCLLKNDRLPLSKLKSIIISLEAIVFDDISIPEHTLKEYEELVSHITKTDE